MTWLAASSPTKGDFIVWRRRHLSWRARQGLGGPGVFAGWGVLAGSAAGAAAGVSVFWFFTFVFLTVPAGMIHRMCFLRRAATSSFVVVCGLSCAISFQRVSLPGTAPLST